MLFRSEIPSLNNGEKQTCALFDEPIQIKQNKKKEPSSGRGALAEPSAHRINQSATCSRSTQRPPSRPAPTWGLLGEGRRGPLVLTCSTSSVHPADLFDTLRPLAAGLHMVWGTKLGRAERRPVLSPDGSNRIALFSLPERRQGRRDFSTKFCILRRCGSGELNWSR